MRDFETTNERNRVIKRKETSSVCWIDAKRRINISFVFHSMPCIVAHWWSNQFFIFVHYENLIKKKTPSSWRRNLFVRKKGRHLRRSSAWTGQDLQFRLLPNIENTFWAWHVSIELYIFYTNGRRQRGIPMSKEKVKEDSRFISETTFERCKTA